MDTPTTEAPGPVGRALAGWRRLYGHHPLHLVMIIGTVALAGYVVSILYTDASAWWLLVWFVGALLGHDLLLFPLYALADRVLAVGHRWRRHRRRRVPVINYLRVPALGAGLLGLIFLPTITRHGEAAFSGTSTLTMQGYFQRWLLLTAVMFAAGLLLYLVALARSGRRARGVQ